MYVSVERFEGGAWDWDCWLNYRLRCLGLGLMGRGWGFGGSKYPNYTLVFGVPNSTL